MQKANLTMAMLHVLAKHYGRVNRIRDLSLFPYISPLSPTSISFTIHLVIFATSAHHASQNPPSSTPTSHIILNMSQISPCLLLLLHDDSPITIQTYTEYNRTIEVLLRSATQLREGGEINSG